MHYPYMPRVIFSHLLDPERYVNSAPATVEYEHRLNLHPNNPNSSLDIKKCFNRWFQPLFTASHRVDDPGRRKLTTMLRTVSRARDVRQFSHNATPGTLCRDECLIRGLTRLCKNSVAEFCVDSHLNWKYRVVLGAKEFILIEVTYDHRVAHKRLSWPCVAAQSYIQIPSLTQEEWLRSRPIDCFRAVQYRMDAKRAMSGLDKINGPHSSQNSRHT